MVLTLSWGACVKIGLLMMFFHASKNMIKKFQEKYCPLCKVDSKGDSCCK
jgi:hypothetical protein